MAGGQAIINRTDRRFNWFWMCSTHQSIGRLAQMYIFLLTPTYNHAWPPLYECVVISDEANCVYALFNCTASNEQHAGAKELEKRNRRQICIDNSKQFVRYVYLALAHTHWKGDGENEAGWQYSRTYTCTFIAYANINDAAKCKTIYDIMYFIKKLTNLFEMHKRTHRQRWTKKPTSNEGASERKIIV